MEPNDITIVDALAATARGEVTAAALCQQHLDRIDEIDRSGPTLRAVLETSTRALDDAGRLDAARERGERTGRMHGIPILVKDSIDTADGMMTAAGSLAMVGHLASQDSFVVDRLRAEGAMIIGKSNMTEWSYMRSARTCSGWSSRGGQIRNPHVLDRTPSGSSGGSAVAVAAGMCVGALGAEVDGSVVRPASANGIVGLKPTVGLLSRSGVMPVAEPQDTVGPMARTVRDVALLTAVMAAPDQSDPATISADRPGSEDFAAVANTTDLAGVRLGVARDLMGTHEGVDRVIADAIDALRDLGATIIDPAVGAWTPFFGEAEVELCLYGFKNGIDRYLASRPASPMKSLAEVIEYNVAHATEVMPYFPQDLFDLAVTKGGLDEPAYLRAAAECRRMSRTDGIDRVLAEHSLDALIAPTDGTPPWAIDLLVGDHIVGGSSAPPAMAGYPHVSVPAGTSHGLPVALSIIGPAWSDARLLGYAHAFEQATRARVAPAFLPTVG